MKKYLAQLLAATMFFSILPLNPASAEAPKEKEATSVKIKKERKELIDKRTNKTKTYQNPDGTLTTEIYQSSVHYQDLSSKEWTEIDNTLVKDSTDNTITNKSNNFNVDFSETISTKTPVLEIEEANKAISLTPSPSESNKVSQSSKAKTKENKVVYEDAFKNADLVYTVGSEKVKEDIVLKKEPEASEQVVYSFSLSLKGLTYEEQQDGRVLFKDKKTGDSLYYLEAPFMYDSAKPEGFTSFSEEAVPEGSFSYDVEMDIHKKGNQLLVDVIPNKEWLQDESRIYPVTIDPTIVKYQPVTDLVDTNIRSALPTQTGGADLELGSGLYKNSTTNNVIRSLLKFDIPDFPAGVRVIDAELNLWASSVWNDTSVNLDLYPVTTTWEENNATWNRRTSSALWTAAGGDYSSAKMSSQTVGALGSSFNANHYKWSITPSYMEQILKSPAQNLGLMLKSASEGTAAYKKFYSGDNLDYAGYSPLLSITYVSNSRLGLEDYWTYDEQPITDGDVSINLGTGNGVIQYNDFDVSGRGGSAISFERTYNTKASESDAFGPGWSFTGSESITESTLDKSITYTDRDGTVHLFPYSATSGKYQSPAGTYLTLVKDGADGYKLTDKYGNISRYKKIVQDSHTSGYTVAKLEYELDLNGNTISYTYNTKGNVTGITDPSGRKMTISYGVSGISSITFEGKKVTYHYTYEGQLKEVRKYKDSTTYTSTFFAYNSNGKLETITDGNGKITKFIYENGFVQSIQEPSTNGTSIPATKYAYNIAAYTSNVTDPEGGITEYQMNNNYVIKSVKDPVNSPTEFVSMDANYNPTQIKDGKGYIINRTYDAKGNLMEEKDPNNNDKTTSYTYDAYSNVKTVTDIKGTTTYTYNTKGDLIGITDPAGSLTEFEYDTYGNKTSAFFPDGSKEFYTYDLLNNYQNTSVDLLGRKTVTMTDTLGNVTSVKEPKGYTTFFTYDQNQLLTSVEDPKNGMTSYGYDENGNMITVTNAAKKVVTMTYNDQNQVTSRKQPMGETTFLSYDNNGNVVRIKKPTDGTQPVTIENRYDAANQLTSVLADGIKKWSYTYDANGETETVKDEATLLTKSIIYYDNGNLKSETKGSQSIQYGYNGANQLTSAKLGSNGVFINQDYELDANGQLENLYRNGFKLANLTYTKTGLPDKVTYTNDIVSDADYDQVQQLDTLTVKKGTTSLLSQSFDYDDNGNVTDVFSSQGDRSYTYDELNQLKSQKLSDGTIESYNYDSVGNRTEKTIVKNGQTQVTGYTYNDNNQLTAVKGQTYTYNKNGDRTKDNRFIYVYNKFDQMEAIKSLSGETVVTYTYDENGRRVSKTVNGKTTNYHYGQGINVLFETDNTGKITAEYSYDQMGFPLTMTKDSQTYYYVLDGHKNVISLTDSAGQSVASYTYDAWGNILTKSGAMADENPYRYAGYRYDNETALYYLMARYYYSQEGVFFSRDPYHGDEKNPSTQNGYIYVNNNPLLYVDPTGHIMNAKTLTKVTASIVAALKAIHLTGYWVTKHVAERAIERSVAPESIAKAIKKGKVYYDPKNGSTVYWINGLNVCVKNKSITTVYWGSPLKRFKLKK